MSDRAPKKKRDVAAKGGALTLVDRDVDVLVLVGLCRYCTGPQIARDLYPSEDRCRRRARALFDAGFLRFTLLSSQAPNLVTLTGKGYKVLQAHRPEVAARIRPCGPVEVAGIPHHLAIVDARLYCAALGLQRAARLSEWSNAGGELGARLGLGRFHLEPDGLAGFATPGGVVYVAVEVDTGSTRVGTTLAEKLSRYQGVAAEGHVDALWIVVTAGAGRVQGVECLAERLGLADWTRVLPLAHVLARPVRELPVRTGAGRETAEGRNTSAAGRASP